MKLICPPDFLFLYRFISVVKDMKATLEQKSPEVSLAAKTKPTTWKVKEGKVKVCFRVLVASYM